MSLGGHHPVHPDNGVALRNRMRDAGMVLVTCAEDGTLQSDPATNESWLAKLLYSSPLFRERVQDTVRRWSADDPPLFAELIDGLWVAPVKITSRRRTTGFSMAVIPSTSLLCAEAFAAMCLSAGLDHELCTKLLAQLPPASEADIPRIAALARLIQQDHARIASDMHAMDHTGQQLAESYEEINLLYTIIQNMTVVERPDRFVTIACDELLGTLPYRWIGMFFADDPQRLKKLADRCFVAGEISDAQEQICRVVTSMIPGARPDVSIVLDPSNNPDHADCAPLGGTALVQPITVEGKVLGLIVAGDKQGEDTAASSVDMKLLAATAGNASIFLENAALYEDINAMFLGTLKALTASIDAKDQYTRGHSERVAHLSQQLARAAGLDDHAVSRVQIAGLVHDVGKIGVPERVLLKPGRLNEEEFRWIQRHPEIGHGILEGIPQLDDILPGVLYHHERFDGRGYPTGLAGTDIPMIARLITLADSFDAMSSSRTYRASMSREEALQEIADCAGTQFDPDLAPIFVKLDFTQFDQLVAEHRAHENPQALSQPPFEADAA